MPRHSSPELPLPPAATPAANEVARRLPNGDVAVRPSSFAARWHWRELRCADGHGVDVIFRATLRPLDVPVERRALAACALVGRDYATAADVAAELEPALRRIAGDASARLAAEELLDGVALQAALAAALNGELFAIGLAVDAAPRVDVSSPSLQREHDRRQRQADIDASHADRLAAIARTGAVWQQVEAMRRAMPDQSVAMLLRALPVADRTAATQAMLRRTSALPTLWCVAGPWLVRLDLAGDPTPRLVPVRQPLGPLRSVTPAMWKEEPVLLLGARHGVAIVALQEGAAHVRAEARGDSADTQLGFSRAIVSGDRLWAVHGSAGVVSWAMGDIASGATLWHPGRAGGGEGPRFLVGFDNAIFFAVGSMVLGGSTTQVPAVLADGDARVVALLPAATQALSVVRADGSLQRLDFSDLRSLPPRLPSTLVTAAIIQPWTGGERLLAVPAAGPILSVGDDAADVMLAYTGGPDGPAAIAATDGFVAALSPDRQRVTLWHADAPATPVATVPLAGLAGHRLADLAFSSISANADQTSAGRAT